MYVSESLRVSVSSLSGCARYTCVRVYVCMCESVSVCQSIGVSLSLRFDPYCWCLSLLSFYFFSVCLRQACEYVCVCTCVYVRVRESLYLSISLSLCLCRCASECQISSSFLPGILACVYMYIICMYIYIYMSRTQRLHYIYAYICHELKESTMACVYMYV